MRKLPHYTLALVAAAALGSAFAGGPVEDTTGKLGADANVNVSLQSLDKNGDGKISKQEAAANKKLNQQFSKLDANHDGSLDAGEFARFEASGSAAGNLGGKPDAKTDGKIDSDVDTSKTAPSTSTAPTDTSKPAKP